MTFKLYHLNCDVSPHNDNTLATYYGNMLINWTCFFSLQYPLKVPGSHASLLWWHFIKLHKYYHQTEDVKMPLRTFLFQLLVTGQTVEWSLETIAWKDKMWCSLHTKPWHTFMSPAYLNILNSSVFFWVLLINFGAVTLKLEKN